MRSLQGGSQHLLSQHLLSLHLLSQHLLWDLRPAVQPARSPGGRCSGPLPAEAGEEARRGSQCPRPQLSRAQRRVLRVRDLGRAECLCHEMRASELHPKGLRWQSPCWGAGHGGGWSCVSQLGCCKHMSRTSGLNSKRFVLTRLEAGSPKAGCLRAGAWERPSSPCLLGLYPPTAAGESELWSPLLTLMHWPILGAPPRISSNPNYLPEAPPPSTNTSGFRASRCGFGGDNTPSTAGADVALNQPPTPSYRSGSDLTFYGTSANSP